MDFLRAAHSGIRARGGPSRSWPLFLALLRYVWASPATLVGGVFGLAALLGGARVHVVHGVLEFGGGRGLRALHRVRFASHFGAITLGHVVIGIDARTLASSRRHERVHVGQYERWGVLFFPAYLGASALQWVRGRDPYLDNPFERAAYREEPLGDGDGDGTDVA